MNGIGLPELIIVLAMCSSLAFVLWPAARICRRIGFPAWLAMLALVPIGNLIFLWFVAYASWPLEAATGVQKG